MNNKTLYTLISSSLLLTACGGGGGSANLTPKSTYNLTGTVPGTLIEAYCDDGSTYSVTSTQNNTNKHPFSLSLPKNLACRVVMITNENDPAKRVVTPIKFIDQKGKSSTIISSNGGDIEIGHIALSLSRSGMTADANSDGVEDIPKEVIINDADARVIERATDPLDTNNNGIPNVYEDLDGDGIPNRYDNDDDGDGIKDINDNDRNNDGVNDDDLDGDGITNNIDVDDDNDGLNDNVDNDDDNDGINDAVDNDDDNDGVIDSRDNNHDSTGEGNDHGGGNDHNGGGNDHNGGGNDHNGGGNDHNGGGNDDNGGDDN